MELGRVGLKAHDVAELLTLYGVVDEQERAALLALAQQADSPGRWRGYDDVLPSWFRSYLGLESVAARIQTYELQFVPGLLQSGSYARAVIELAYQDDPVSLIERRVELRMERQRVLTQPDGPRLVAVLDEAVLRRPIGSAEVMRDQLAQLLKLATLPNVTIQVLRFQTGGHAAFGGAFTLLGLPGQQTPQMVYMEQLDGAIYLDRPDEVTRYAAAMRQLCGVAERPERTPELLDAAMREL